MLWISDDELLATVEIDETEDEYRRLLYVAMTRAKEHLHLVVPNRFYVKQQAQMGDRHMYASRTRFIPERLLPMFERTTWPRAAAAQASTANRAPPIDIGARMRGMWR